ncbi:MAG TPA: prolyl-tRNA synthetase associated domain-containing protein [Gemmatimonadaceae bacterium]
MPDLNTLLARLGIEYTRYEHEPLHTCEAALAAIPDKSSVQTKNLFLRDKPGRRHILLVTSCEKPVDIKKFGESIEAGRLSFASPERMAKYLGVAPGSVTVLGLLNDASHAVELFVDTDVWNAEKWNCHPLVNTATLVIRRADIEKFLAHTGHVARVVRVPSGPAQRNDLGTP